MVHRFIVFITVFAFLISNIFIGSAQAQITAATAPVKQIEQINQKKAKPNLALSRPSSSQSTQLHNSVITENNNPQQTGDKSDGLSLNEILTLCISFASLVISGVTVIVGWKVYQKFLSQKLAENQLQVVLDLIQAIYKNVFNMTTVRRHGSEGMGYGYDYKNLFQLANGGALEADSPYNYPIILLESYTFTFEPWTFLSNPLLPDRIAKKLHAFHDSIVMIPAKPEKLMVYMVIGKMKKNYTGPEFALSQFEGGFSGFLGHCAAIDYEVKKWLKDHGLTDLNQHVVSTEYKRWLV